MKESEKAESPREGGITGKQKWGEERENTSECVRTEELIFSIEKILFNKKLMTF